MHALTERRACPPPHRRNAEPGLHRTEVVRWRRCVRRAWSGCSPVRPIWRRAARGLWKTNCVARPGLVVDSGGLVAIANAKDRFHPPALAVLSEFFGELIATWPAV